MLELDFIKHYSANADHIMWFLGAGTSRTAGMPTATDLIWDLKLKYYCREENQNLDSHDLTNESIKAKVQRYMNSKGFPALWSPEEYSFYFDLTFGNNYSEQQKYLVDKLSDDNITLNIGHRALVGLIKLNKARVIFTTNFDGVIEKAYSQVTGSNITAYHLEGSYAALEALNRERYPIYSKIHGDFRYQKVKNLTEDLISNDEQIQKCFVAASNRFGIIVTGYSGRDKNVMDMFTKALEHENAFPAGLFWTVPSLKQAERPVIEFISKAKEKNINAHIVETGTFDSMLSKLWRQTLGKDPALESKVRTALTKEVNISMPQKGTAYPILRTNALPIVAVPTECALIETKTPLSHIEVKELVQQNHANSIISREDNIIGWGSEEEIFKALGKDQISAISKLKILDPIGLISKNKGYHSFYERALAISLCNEKPFLFRNDKGFVLVVDPKRSSEPLFTPLLEALKGKNGEPWPISGVRNSNPKVFWSEAIRIKLEPRNNQLFLMLTPILWIEPNTERQKHIEFIKTKLRYRYNSATHTLLNAWINVLFDVGSKEKELGCYKDTNFPAVFKINTRTAYSKK